MTPRGKLLSRPAYHEQDWQLTLCDAASKFMERKGLSAEELRQRLGLSKRAMRMLLNGESDLKMSKMIEIILAMGKFPVFKLIPNSVELYDQETKPEINHDTTSLPHA